MFLALVDMMQFAHDHADVGTVETVLQAKLAAFRLQFVDEGPFLQYLTTYWIANGKMGKLLLLLAVTDV